MFFTRSSSLSALLFLSCCVLFFVWTSTPVSASHFAYGTISWAWVAAPNAPFRYSINFEAAYRRNYGSFQPSNPSVGQTFTCGDIGSFTLSGGQYGPCCGRPSGDSCWSTYYNAACRGCCGSYSQSLNIAFLVKATYPDNWLVGQTPTMFIDLPAAIVYRIVYSMCCRISTLVYSRDSSAIVQAVIIPGHLFSPRSTSFPRQYVSRGKPVSWVVPSIHPANLPLTYDITPTSDSGMTQAIPPSFGLSGTTGVVSWTPSANGLYAVSFRIYGSNNQGTAWVTLDTIFEVVNQCNPGQPGCTSPPYFSPALPVEWVFYQGTTASYTVVARDDNGLNLDVLTSPLPDGAAFNFISSTGANPKFFTYQLIWSPTLSSVPATVCFTARNTAGISSQGNNCVKLIFGTGATLYVTGILRDFHKSSAYPIYLTDFNRGDGDVGVNYVSTTLGNNGLPVWNNALGANSQTVAQANLPWWWTTDPSGQRNAPINYAIVLNNGTTARPNIFSWSSGDNWWPLDNQLFGNEGDARNRYFTYEIHTFITYLGGETLVFRSSDDLFVFINDKLPTGWNMGGIVSSQLRTFSVNLDTFFSPSDRSKTFPVDIFYAHRSATGIPQLQIQLLSATVCDSFSSGLLLLNYGDFSTGSQWVRTLGASAISGTRLQLISNAASVTSAAWFSSRPDATNNPTPTPFKIQYGFLAEFTFQLDGVSEGFAFVLQNNNPSARGGDGGQLGYGGLSGITNSIAFEFDLVQQTSLGDPSWQHVSIHTRLNLANDASESYRVIGSTFSPNTVPFTFNNGTVHKVKIAYQPAVDDGSTGPKYGWMRVYVGNIIAPVAEAQVDGVQLDSMWNGAAYVGFTAANSDTNRANIYINSFKLTSVPPDAKKSGAIVLPTDLAAGLTGSMTIQLRDLCGNRITTGGELASIAGTVSLGGVVQASVPVTVVDNRDGTYTLSFAPRKVGTYTIAATLGGATISGSPWTFRVTPGATSPPACTYTISWPANALSGTGDPYAGVTGTLVVTAYDAFGNLQTLATDPFVVSFAPDISLTGSLSGPTGSQPTYTFQFQSKATSVYTLYVRLNGQDVAGSPRTIRFAPGLASAAQSSVAGSGLSTATAGSRATFGLTLRDSSGNAITSQNPADVSCINAADGCKITPSGANTPQGGITTGVPAPVDSTVTCAWAGSSLSCGFTANIAGTYSVVIMINGQAVSIPAGSLTISPAGYSSSRSVFQMPGSAVAGVASSITLQARDQYDNNILTPLPNGVNFASSFSPSLKSPAAAPSFVSGGSYTIAFVPDQSDPVAYSVTLTLAGTNMRNIANGGSNPASITAISGPAHTSSTFTGLVSTVIASDSTTSSFTIASRDQFNNRRISGGKVDDYLITLSPSGSNNIVYSNVANITVNQDVHTVNWRFTLAGTYTLRVLVRATSQDITGSPTSVTVNPAALSLPNCILSGAGLSAGVVNSSAPVTIQARDRFNNNLLSTSGDSFRVIITSTSNTAVTTAFVRSNLSPFSFSVNYVVPSIGSTFTINIQASISGTWTSLPGYPSSLDIIPSREQLCVSLTGPNAASGSVAAVNTFSVIEKKCNDGTPFPGGRILNIQIVQKSTPPQGQQAVSVDTISVTTLDATGYIFNVSYVPRFQLPSDGLFNIIVSRGSIVAQAGVNAAASPFPLTISPGVINAPSCIVAGLPNTVVAGSRNNLTVDLFDAFNNRITGAVDASQFSAVFSPGGTTVPAVIDTTFNAGKRLVFYYNLTTINTYSVTVRYNGLPVGSVATPTVTVNPNVPSALTTTVQPTASTPLPSSGYLFNSLIAGRTNYQFSLLVRDYFGNPVDAVFLNGGAIDSYVTFALQDSAVGRLAASVGPAQYVSVGVWSVPIVAYKAAAANAPWPLRVTLSGTVLPTPVYVPTTRDLAAAAGTVQGLPTTIVAGTVLSFRVAVTDSYDNAWGGGIVNVVGRDASGAGYSATVSEVSGTAGTYQVTFPAIYTRLAGTFSLEVRANGVLIGVPQTVTTLTITPGPLDPTQTDVPPFLPTVLAGTNTTIQLTLKDSFGNLITNPNAVSNSAIQTRFTVWTGDTGCDANGQSISANSSEIAASADNGFTNVGVIYFNSSYFVSFTSILTGKFNVNITIQGVELSCDRSARLALVVTPGAAVARNSQVSGLKNMVAGETVVWTLVVRDSFGNQLASGGTNVTFNYADFASAYSITDQQNGVFTITATITRAGTQQLQVRLLDGVVPTVSLTLNPDGSYSTTVISNSFTVKPNVASRWTVARIPDAIYEASPFSVDFQVTDAYANPISVLSAEYNYTYSIIGQPLFPAQYSFGALTLVFDAASGTYRWTGVSAYSGNVTLQVNLVQFPHPICSALSTKAVYLCSDSSCKENPGACPDAANTKGSVNIFILPATCGRLNPATPYRCPPADNSICVSDYTKCPSLSGANQVCPSSAPVRCAVDNSCQADGFLCPCMTPGFTRCRSGVCVNNTATDCHPTELCPSGTVPCLRSTGNGTSVPTGQCRANTQDCPSVSVCAPGYVLCDNGFTCGRNLTDCNIFPAVTTSTSSSSTVAPTGCPSGTFPCWDGKCTRSALDCATPTSCAAGQVFCATDGSCRATSSACPDQPVCFGLTPYRCADGTCSSAPAGCPAQPSCPAGWTLCANGQCAKTSTSCLASPTCTLDQIRCPDGTCAKNLLFCPTSTTCPTTLPTRCPDGSCARAVSFCPTPLVCPALSTVCPDGSCIVGNVTCPTQPACPQASPVLCVDGITCVSDLSSCPAPVTCPVQTPTRCPDGSCRADLLDCPSRSSCPSSRPVSCPDGSCVFSSQQCTALPSCPANTPIRCPGGECAVSFSTCPSHVTCPVGSLKCLDGSCRTDCSTVTVKNCPLNQVTCPVPASGVGVLCADSIAQCPSSFACPASKPVRCLDATCAGSLANCPALPANGPETNKVPCPDGSWTANPSTCNTPALCPAAAPFKCYDETCRVAPADCPVPTACPTADKPYRCSNGACAASPYSSDCLLTLQSINCPPSAPVKCPATFNCVQDINQCTAVSSTTTSANVSTTSVCPSGWARCRDGSCKQSLTSCPASACPAAVPYLCANGACAVDARSCPDNRYGCFPPLLPCTTTGQCVKDPTDVQQCPVAVNDLCFTQCPDGLCISKSQVASYDSICSGRQCALRCTDGTCGLVSTSAVNITATTPGNRCTQPGSTDPARPLLNVCPTSLPYRCPNGLCAVSSINCVVPPQTVACPSTTPVQCANGACVVHSAQCAPLYPCPAGQYRCGDGTCRPVVGVNCTVGWGIQNTCPYLPSGQQLFRCPNGVCSDSTDGSGCLDLNTGCPLGSPTRCPSGACLSIARYVPDFFNTSILRDNCDNWQVPSTDGCPAGTTKCIAQGQCVANPDTQCTDRNGCLPGYLRCPATDSTGRKLSGKCVTDMTQCDVAPSTCVRCVDGSCAVNNTASNCVSFNGCPATRPYRCANGQCARFPTSALLQGAALADVCPPVVICPAGKVLCYGGSCADSVSLCPPARACEYPRVQCADRTCADSAAQCTAGVINANGLVNITGVTNAINVLLKGCPASAPVICPDGLCVSSYTLCVKITSPGSATGTGVSGQLKATDAQNQAATGGTNTVVVTGPSVGKASVTTQTGACSGATPVECIDGSCQSDFAACMAWAASLTASTIDKNSLTNGCPVGQTMCPNGVCVLDKYGNQTGLAQCAPIRSCGTGMYRCADGSCVDDTAKCPTVSECGTISLPGFQPIELRRCQDGVCRYNCPPFDGCPHTTAPFQCKNRECATGPDQCRAAGVAGPFVYSVVKSTLLKPWKPIQASARRLLQALSSSTGAVAPSGNSADNSDTDTTGASNSYCYSNCRGQVKALSYTTSVSTTDNNVLTVATDAANVVQTQITIPAGAFVSNSSSGSGLATRVAVTIKPVAESVVRNAETRVPTSRTAVFPGKPGYLTSAQTLLSPMFEFTVDETVRTPFVSNVTVTSLIDTNLKLEWRDICFAKLYTVNAIGFSAWRCILNNTGLAPPVRTDSSTGSSDEMTGSFGEPGVYAFIASPVPDPAPESLTSWARRNGLWLFLGLAGALFVIFGIIYWASRLHRYRKKYHEERERVKRKREDVETMEQYGGAAGNKDDEVAMISNPMVMQMKDMQARLDHKALELAKEEQKAKEEQNQARSEHINELKNDRDKLHAELEKLRSELQLSTGSGAGRPAAIDMTPARPANTGNAIELQPVSRPVPSSPSAHPAAVAPSASSAAPGFVEHDDGTSGAAARTEFQAQRPKKKGKEIE